MRHQIPPEDFHFISFSFFFLWRNLSFNFKKQQKEARGRCSKCLSHYHTGTLIHACIWSFPRFAHTPSAVPARCMTPPAGNLEARKMSNRFVVLILLFQLVIILLWLMYSKRWEKRYIFTAMTDTWTLML